MTTPAERALMEKINVAYTLLGELHASQGLGFVDPLMLCGYDEVNDITLVVNFQYLPGRRPPEELLKGEDFTALHLTEKPTLTIVPKD